MNLYESIKKNLNEAESTLVTADEVRGDIFNCLEMYSEDQWNGADDDYAQEVLEQNLYDAILAVVEKHLGLTFDDIVKMPRETDPSTIIYNQFLDYVYAPSNKELDADEAIKVFVGMCNKVFNEYKAKNGLKESNNSQTPDYINELNDLRHKFFNHLYKVERTESDDEIKKRIEEVLNEIPDGTTLCQNYKDTSSGYTSRGGYYDEYAVILKYTKKGDKWETRHGLKDTHDMMMSVLYNDGDMKTLEQAEQGQKEMSKTLHHETRDYAPKSTIDPNNPHWDGNFYGI